MRTWCPTVAGDVMAKLRLNLAEIWNSSDPRDVPAYTIPEAAHYLCIPKATLRAWVLGQRGFEHVIDLSHPQSHLLSFYNLAEAHILRSLRTGHEIQLPRIRKALDFVRRRFGWARPLIQQEFKTDGLHLFVESLDQVYVASEEGQLVMREVMVHLERLEWEDNIAARLYPFTRSDPHDAPKSVIIDPRHSFGRPILKDARITTAIIAERYKAGESIQALADDYGCSNIDVEEGIRCELRLSTAA
jgi:uncharacterized protein (DUF433 family)